MAQEIGVAYVSLLPSGKGFSKGVQNEAESAFKGAEKSSDGFFSNVTKWAKRGALAVGGMVATVGALAIGGGIARALNIEDATAKLKGLGNDTQTVEAIMKDALASVKGTAFGLDAAATTAASAVAAGIKPGQELERYLRLTADAATIAGVSMEEMGSILNQVTSKGYAGMENLNRLTERGIPILQWLAEEYGVSADELAKMVSRGEVDAATFRKVIEENIGGAALASGDTTRGAFANMGAALSRLGLAFVGDGLTGAKTFFNEITVILDGLEERIGPWAQGIQDKLGGLVDLDGFGERFLSSLDSFIANFDATPFGILLTTLKPLVPVLQELGARVGPVLADTFAEIAEALEPMIPLLSEALVDAIAELAPPLTDLLIALLPLIPPLVALAVDVIPILTEALALIIPLLIPLVDGVTGFYTVVSDLLNLLTGNVAVDEFGKHLATAQGPIYDITRAIADFITPAINGLTETVSRLVSYWQTGWSLISSFFSFVGSTISGTASSLWGNLTSMFSTGVAQVSSIFSALPRHIQNLFAGASAWLVSSGRALIQGFINGITSMIGAVGSAVGGVMEWAAGFFPHSPADRGPFSGSGWDEVFDGGESLMEQFARGATSFRPELNFGNIAGSIQGITSVGDTYVENPFTGEYLLAKVGAEAEARVGAYDSSRQMSTRGGWRRS